MEMVKRFMFWIGIAVASVAIIAMYFVLVRPIKMQNKATAEQIEKMISQLQRFEKKGKNIRNEKWIEWEKKRQKTYEKQFKELQDWYINENKDLEHYKLEGIPVTADGYEALVFKEIYAKERQKLIDEYADVFGESVAIASWLGSPSDKPTNEEMQQLTRALFLYRGFLRILRKHNNHEIAELRSLKFDLKIKGTGPSVPGGGQMSVPGMMPAGGPPPEILMQQYISAQGLDPSDMTPELFEQIRSGAAGGGIGPPGAMPSAGGPKGAADLFDPINFTIEANINFRELPRLLGDILQKSEMDPEFRMFTNINKLSIERVSSYEASVAPIVKVTIEGSVLDFKKKEVVGAQEKLSTGRI